MSKKWSKTEISYLKRYAGVKRLDQLNQRFGVESEEMEAKLVELGLTSKDGAGVPATDPMVEVFESAAEALYGKKWATAEKLLHKVIDQAEAPDLAGRARQYLKVARQRREEAVDDGAKDPFLRSVFLKNVGELAEALKICKAGKRPEDDRFVYLAASIHAAEGRLDEAAETLSRAIELNPENRVHAFHEPDFIELRQDPDYAELFGLG